MTVCPATDSPGGFPGWFGCLFQAGVDSAADGTFVIGGFGTGSYLLHFGGQFDEWTEQWYDGVLDHTLATPIAVTLGADTPGRNGVMSRYPTITGTVTAVGGAPIEGAMVTAVAVDFSAQDSVFTDAAGHYSTGHVAGRFLHAGRGCVRLRTRARR